MPAATDTAASIELGQPNMTSGTANNAGLSALTMNTPTGVFNDSDTLFLSRTAPITGF